MASVVFEITLSSRIETRQRNPFPPPRFGVFGASSPVAATETMPQIDFETDLDEDLLSDTPWNVVLLDDDHHTYDYVVEMLMEIFGYSVEKAFQMTVEVDTRKRVIVWSGHLERAEAYLEEIHEYGPDWRMESSLGSMSARLEKAR